MKHLNQYITEYIVKKKLDTPIDSEDHYDYFPESKDELTENIEELVNKGIYNFNCIDTSKITDMSYLFKDLNNKIENNDFDVSDWDVSNVENMNYMFNGCINFDGDLSNWDVSNVESMVLMFKNCSNFTGKGLDKWNVSKLKTKYYDIFDSCKKLKKIPNWNKL